MVFFFLFFLLYIEFLTLCAPHLAGLHETQQGDEVLDDAEVLGARGAAGVDGHSHQQLLDVTHQELVVVQGNAAEGGREQTLRRVLALISRINEQRAD